MKRMLLSGLLALPLGYGAASVLLGDWLSSSGRPLAPWCQIGRAHV